MPVTDVGFRRFGRFGLSKFGLDGFGWVWTTGGGIFRVSGFGFRGSGYNVGTFKRQVGKEPV